MNDFFLLAIHDSNGRGTLIMNDAKLRLLQAQALLDVFEKDCGRLAESMFEVRCWATAQNSENLEFRVKRRLLEMLYGNSIEQQSTVERVSGDRPAQRPRNS
jgi:hypothetical protein